MPYVVFWHQLPCSMDYILAFSLDWCFNIFHAHWFCLGLWILWFDIWYVSLILFYRASWISSWHDLWVMFCCCLSSSFALWLIVAAIFSFQVNHFFLVSMLFIILVTLYCREFFHWICRYLRQFLSLLWYIIINIIRIYTSCSITNYCAQYPRLWHRDQTDGW